MMLQIRNLVLWNAEFIDACFHPAIKYYQTMGNVLRNDSLPYKERFGVDAKARDSKKVFP